MVLALTCYADELELGQLVLGKLLEHISVSLLEHFHKLLLGYESNRGWLQDFVHLTMAKREITDLYVAIELLRVERHRDLLVLVFISKINAVNDLLRPDFPVVWYVSFELGVPDKHPDPLKDFNIAVQDHTISGLKL